MRIRISKYTISALLLLSILHTGVINAQDRGKRVNTAQPNKLNTPMLQQGRGIALIIGTDKYNDNYWKPLSNPVLDATTVSDILKSRYNYETELLINPTKDEIFLKLLTLRDNFNKGKYGENTNLFIFIAGHGSYDDFSKGYIVPADARNPDADVSKSSYIEYTVIKDKINEIPADHILLVLDVCNGGTFDAIKLNADSKQAVCNTFSGSDYKTISISELITKSGKCRSRKFIASGGNETVFDGLAGDHSPFAKEVILALNKGHYNKRITTFGHLCYNIADISTSKPVFSDFSKEMSGGDFLFIPNSITHDAPLAKHYNPPPQIPGYATNPVAGKKLLILPRQNNYEPVSSTLNDPAMRTAITYLTEAFQSQDFTPVYFDFTQKANAADDKQQIIKKSGADLYIEVDLKTANDGTGANNVSVTLTCVQLPSGSLKYTKTFRGPYYRTEDYEALAEKALEEYTEEIIELTIK
jgi:hypothetical protein